MQRAHRCFNFCKLFLFSSSQNKPRFLPVTTLDDTQAIRCAEFHPRGNFYVVGSNSKTLRVCAYPKLHNLRLVIINAVTERSEIGTQFIRYNLCIFRRNDHEAYQTTVLFERTKHHKGSVYCMAWTPIGDLLATGSNDKTVKLLKFNNDTAKFEGLEN